MEVPSGGRCGGSTVFRLAVGGDLELRPDLRDSVYRRMQVGTHC